MTRSQSTPMSSQLMTMARLLEEKEIELEETLEVCSKQTLLIVELGEELDVQSNQEPIGHIIAANDGWPWVSISPKERAISEMKIGDPVYAKPGAPRATLKECSEKDQPPGLVEAALDEAFRLGQLFWAQADSEKSAEWKKSEGTVQRFRELKEKTSELLR